MIPGGTRRGSGRPRVRLQAAIAWGAAALYAAFLFYLSSLPACPEPFEGIFIGDLDKVAHLGAYAVLGGLLWWAMRASGADPKRAAVFAIVLSLLYAVSDEFHQSYVPNREMSAVDGVADLAGAALGAGGLLAISRRRARRALSRSNSKRPAVR